MAIEWRCPKCGNHERLLVVARCVVYLSQTEDNFETEDAGDGHEWDSESEMTCRDCHYHAPSKAFEV